MTELPESLARVLDRATDQASPSRARQLRWVANELVRAAQTAPWPVDDAAGWFHERFVTHYLTAAEQGLFRQRSPARDAASTAASMRVRRSCLAALAAAGGIAPDHVPATGSTTPPAEGADLRDVTETLRCWRAEAGARDALSITVRAAAVAHLVHELCLRTGELVSMTVDDVDLTGRRVRYTPAPQAARSSREPVWADVSPVTADLLRLWLRHREAAITSTPHITALWVTLAGNHLSERVLPAGLPLQPRGVIRAHAAAVERLNEVLAGTPSWHPMSTHLADIRRSSPRTRDTAEPA